MGSSTLSSFDPRRPGLAGALIVIGYACVIGLISAIAVEGNPNPPTLVPRPILLALLLSVPGFVAAIGAVRRSRPILLAAAVLCFLQSFLAFSGVTFAFLVPALLLLAVGLRGGAPVRARAVVGACLVVVLGVSSLIIPLFVATEAACWIVRVEPDGDKVYRSVPYSNTIELGPEDSSGGCSERITTTQGVILSLAVAVAAIGVAELASRPRPPTS
jgi:hypothetical protein